MLCYGDSNTHGTRLMTRAGVLARFAREGVHFAADQHRALGQRVAALPQQIA
ncbi:hypothetical protein [Burkholderia sp. Se-20373]|uniref:hypothetical protein n=1 Tax=Burkholderia sp. Se-20373 TaxID=2703898 RepID=UPI001F119F03|nr:hypothetical protein [Burkholderia sp. Se-20373]